MRFITPDSVALVAAGSAGLGAAICRVLAGAGARVVVNYGSNRERAEELVTELTEIRRRALSQRGAPRDSQKASTAIAADMGSRTEIQRLVREASEVMGRLDVVISNQGWTRMRNFNDLDDNVDESDWDGCFNMNVKSHLWLMHAAKPFLERGEDGGAFITTASLAGVVPSGSSLAYSVTKAAQIHLAKALAGIAAPKIRVNSIAPGILLTEWGKKFPSEKLDAAREKAKLKRLATVEDVAENVLLLVESRSVTGTNSVIDAGWRL